MFAAMVLYSFYKLYKRKLPVNIISHNYIKVKRIILNFHNINKNPHDNNLKIIMEIRVIKPF